MEAISLGLPWLWPSDVTAVIPKRACFILWHSGDTTRYEVQPRTFIIIRGLITTVKSSLKHMMTAFTTSTCVPYEMFSKNNRKSQKHISRDDQFNQTLTWSLCPRASYSYCVLCCVKTPQFTVNKRSSENTSSNWTFFLKKVKIWRELSSD